MIYADAAHLPVVPYGGIKRWYGNERAAVLAEDGGPMHCRRRPLLKQGHGEGLNFRDRLTLRRNGISGISGQRSANRVAGTTPTCRSQSDASPSEGSSGRQALIRKTDRATPRPPGQCARYCA
jgi:hypothetical protein